VSTSPPAAGAPSFAGRFAAAIALTIGFYVLALAIAAALLAVAILPWVAHHGNPFLTITGLVLGVSVLVAIFPRRHRFEAPGLRVSEEDQPGLLALVREEADAAGEPMPDEVYLTLDANAAVTEAGRGRRVLIVGMPLLHILSERELRGVLAHEFGHYTGGDTRLGPWLHRTHSTIARTLERLHDDDGDESFTQTLVRKPFEWYGIAFLRITAAIRRREEFAADALAARRAGRDVHVAALRRIHAFAPAFDTYWTAEVVPILNTGRRPPVSEGFRRFIAADWVEEAAAEHLEHELAEKTDPYSSHPSLAERIAAARHEPAGEPDGSACAIELLADPEPTERRALDAAFGPEVALMDSVGWDRIGDVWLERAHESTTRCPAVLARVTVGGLPDAVASLPATANALVDEGYAPEAAPDIVATLLGDGLLVALERAGWQVEAPIAAPVTAVRGADRVVPAAIVRQLRAGELEAGEWRERASALGIAELPLAAPVEEAEPVTRVQAASS
jgi:Zn-dependent protease with chaperone function